MNGLVLVSPSLLAVGSIVPPGNFGKNILAHSPDRTDGWMIARELVFEHARMMVAPHLPSRLTCNYLFSNDAMAIAAMGELQGPVLAPRVYTVELVDPSAPTCKADYDTFRMIQRDNFYVTANQAAMSYWATARSGQIREGCIEEVLTMSPVRVTHAPTQGQDMSRVWFPTIHLPVPTTTERESGYATQTD